MKGEQTGGVDVPSRCFTSTTDAESERRLAKSLGYPSPWHVVRQVPHPADVAASSSKGVNAATYKTQLSDDEGSAAVQPMQGATCMDTIYAGDPSTHPDTYFNHSAALKAALNWVEGESTGFEDGGGQLLPRTALFDKGDWVEVHYPDDDMWYKAQVEKVKHYVDDIRYTVHYKDEDATQVVSEELMRKASPPAPKKRKNANKKKDDRKKSASSTVKRGKPDYASRFNKKELKERQALAKEMGLPEFWLATRQSKKFVIYSPAGDRFTTKKAAFESLGWDPDGGQPDESEEDEEEDDKPPPSKRTVQKETKRKRKSDGDKRVSKKNKKALGKSESTGETGKSAINRKREQEEFNKTSESVKGDKKKKKGKVDSVGNKKRKKRTLEKTHFAGEEGKSSQRQENTEKLHDPRESEEDQDMREDSAAQLVIEEEGDPPWRRSGHRFLDRKVRYARRPNGDSEDSDEEEIAQIGRVTGWLDSTDVDSNGDPAFLSEANGEPAKLFHVSFVEEGGLARPDDLLYMDLEEFELLECMLPTSSAN